MSEPELIPFGKYRGLPVDAVLEDREYSEWLIAQAWFRERYQNLYVTIQNGGAQSDMTPEHNRMQARFLDEDYVSRFGKRVLKSIRSQEVSGEIKSRQLMFEVNGWDVFATLQYPWVSHKDGVLRLGEFHVYIELKPVISDDFPAVLRQVKSRKSSSEDKLIVICDSFDQHSAVPFDSVRKMFLSSGILLIQSSEIE